MKLYPALFMNSRYEKSKCKDVKGSAELRLAEIALAILRNESRALSLFKAVWLRNRIICE